MTGRFLGSKRSYSLALTYHSLKEGRKEIGWLFFLRLISHEGYIRTNLKEGTFSLMGSNCGSKATLNRNEGTSGLSSCVKAVVVVLGSPSLIASTVSMDAMEL